MWTRSGPEVNQKWTRSGPEVDQKWTGIGPEVGRKRTGSGLEVDRCWPEVDQMRTRREPKWTAELDRKWNAWDLQEQGACAF